MGVTYASLGYVGGDETKFIYINNLLDLKKIIK